MTTLEAPPGAPDSFARTASLVDDLTDLARRHGLSDANVVETLVAVATQLVAVPNSVFTSAPEYVRPGPGPASEPTDPSALLKSTHAFFDVLAARASRRDFGTAPLAEPVLRSVLQWTFGQRGETIAYDYRNAPLRYAPSAGGLASVDAYVIVNNVDGLDAGSYYFDYRCGLRRITRGYMARKVADMTPGQDWLAGAGALVVFVANCNRVEHKYGPMGFKLLMLDAGIAIGHAELVATSLELRTTIVGGLPAAGLARLLRLEGTERVPLVTLAVGSRSGHG